MLLNRTTKELTDILGPNPSFDPSVYIHNPDLSGVVGVPIKYWKITGDVVSEMTTEEKAVVDAAELAAEKVRVIGELSISIRDYIWTHYEIHRQTTFAILLLEAMYNQYWNRWNYIWGGVQWVQMVIGYYYQIEAAINAQTTLEAVDLIEWNTAQFDALDPAVTIIGANTQPEQPRITSALAHAGTVDVELTPYAITTAGGVRAAASFSATGLPAGLSVDTATGIISGTPTESGTFNVTIGTENPGGTDSKTLVLTIAGA